MASKAVIRTLAGGAARRTSPRIPPPAFAGIVRASAPRAAVSASVRWHGGPSVPADAPTVSVTFVDTSAAAGGPDRPDRVAVSARVGESLLQTAHRHKIPIEGACEGVCACSTCHVILDDELYDSLIDAGQEPSEDEEDMLDMAPGLTATSRLGCQVTVTDAMDGVEIKLPAMTRNFYVDGHVPEPH